MKLAMKFAFNPMHYRAKLPGKLALVAVVFCLGGLMSSAFAKLNIVQPDARLDYGVAGGITLKRVSAPDLCPPGDYTYAINRADGVRGRVNGDVINFADGMRFNTVTRKLSITSHTPPGAYALNDAVPAQNLNTDFVLNVVGFGAPAGETEYKFYVNRHAAFTLPKVAHHGVDVRYELIHERGGELTEIDLYIRGHDTIFPGLSFNPATRVISGRATVPTWGRLYRYRATANQQSKEGVFILSASYR